MVQENILLSNSTYCRLCAEDNTNGISLFTEQEDLCMLINRYLPIKVENDDPFPKTICPGCHIQLEATKLFMDLIIDGQKKLRDLLKGQQDLLDREEKERQKLEEVLQNHNPNASVETYTIQADENGEKFIIQIYSEGSLFPPNHELAVKAERLDKPKRKRGRPPKSTAVITETDPPVKNVKSEDVDCYVPKIPDSSVKESNKEQNDSLGRKKRIIKAPVRYEGVVEGEELDKILKKEGVIDEEPLKDEKIDIKEEPVLIESLKINEKPIGKIVSDDGDFVKPVFLNRRPPRIKKYGFRSKKFTCNVCKRDFIHQGRYELHKKSHKIKFVCQEKDCQFQDEDKQAVVKHQEGTQHAGVSRIESVDEINGTVLLPDEPKTEKPDETSTTDMFKTLDKSIKCPTCDKTFSCKQNYEVHLKAVHDGVKPYKCEVCQKLFAYACSLKNHMISHKNKEPDCAIELYPCDKCDKLFQRPSSLIYHKDTEHGNQRFVCNKCNREFKHRQLLQRHQLVHSNERPFKCSECSQTFKTRTNMINHENCHKGIKKFTCSICGQCFLYKTSLAMHIRWHEGNKPYQCDVCKKSFSQKGNLAEHKRIHTGEKPFTCDTCGRSFTTSSQFKLHCKRHTGERPYGCEYCNKRFLHKETYDTHIRRHLDIRPYKCPHCPKAFTESWACSRHQKVHTGEKPYKCGVCERAFSDASNFNKHTRLHLANGRKTQNANTTAEKPKEVPIQPAPPPSTPPPTMDIQILIPSQPQIAPQKEQDLIPDIPTTGSLQIQELVDDDGNVISLTTADGQPIPIVSSGGTEKIQGLMPDGTLVSFDIFGGEMQDKVEMRDEGDVADEQLGLLNTEIQFLEENSISNSNDSASQEKPAFLTEDGKVCFIASFDENSFLTMS